MTTDFSHGYSPPGVVVTEDTTSSVTITGAPPSRLALVGPSVGYRETTEQVALGAAVTLTQKGLVTSSVVISEVGTGVVVASGDYTLTASGPTTGNDFYTNLARSGSAVTVAGTEVYISYHYIPPDYFSARLFDNFEDVKDTYGEPVNYAVQAVGDLTYQPISSPLSLAAQVAFENGVSEIVMCPTAALPSGAVTDAAKSSARRQVLSAAYAEIDTDYNIAIVVPVTQGIATADAAGTATDLRTHIIQATADDYPRVGVIGFDAAVTTAPDTLIANASLASRRIMFAFAAPGGLQYFAGGANAAYTVGHGYLAVAYGSKMASQSPARSLTRQQVQSFVGIAGTPLSNSLKNQYAAGGVAVTEIDRRGRMIVRHGVTTDMTSINTREMSVVRARDALVSVVQNGLDDSGLIGTPIDLDTALNVKSIVSGLLEQTVQVGTIISYTGLGVRQLSSDPSVIEVKFSYRPAYPLNYVLVSFSINVTTGNVTVAEAA